MMEQKTTARDKPSPQQPAEKKTNGFVRFLKFVFVKNIELKALAILTSALMWALIVGLG